MLREIQTFVIVCRCGTFTAAGQQLGMTQSAVSDHIRRLEAYVGTTLFHRTGRSATLNAAGENLRPLAEEATQLAGRMRVGAVAGALRGNLRVGTVASLHNTLLARSMIAFRAAHPQATVRLVRHEGCMLAQVEREELDLAVMVYADRSVPPRMSLQPLLDLPFVLIAPKGLACRSWREAARALPLLRYDASSASGRDVDSFLARAGVEVVHSFWINYLDTMISLVARGLGVAFVPRTPLGPARRYIEVFSLGQETFHRRVGVLRRLTSPSGGQLTEAFNMILIQEAVKEPFAVTPTDPTAWRTSDGSKVALTSQASI